MPATHQDSRRGQENRRAFAAGIARKIRGEWHGAAQECTVASSGNDIVNALLALGYNEKEADWAAKQLPKDADVSDGIRQALKLLSKA